MIYNTSRHIVYFIYTAHIIVMTAGFGHYMKETEKKIRK